MGRNANVSITDTPINLRGTSFVVVDKPLIRVAKARDYSSDQNTLQDFFWL